MSVAAAPAWYLNEDDGYSYYHHRHYYYTIQSDIHRCLLPYGDGPWGEESPWVPAEPPFGEWQWLERF